MGRTPSIESARQPPAEPAAQAAVPVWARWEPWAVALILALGLPPRAVLLSRQAEPEALQAVLLLAALLLTLRISEARAGPWMLPALLLCALAAPLAKVSGIAVAGICAMILVAEGRWRLAAA